jgi:hypothetical protein
VVVLALRIALVVKDGGDRPSAEEGAVGGDEEEEVLSPACGLRRPASGAMGCCCDAQASCGTWGAFRVISGSAIILLTAWPVEQSFHLDVDIR